MNQERSDSNANLAITPLAESGDVADPAILPDSGQPAAEFVLPIPAILLEGDDPPSVDSVAECFAPFSSGPESSEELETEDELPNSYSTGRLELTARDPNWLFAHWDLTPEQMLWHNELSPGNPLVLRVNRKDDPERAVAEVSVRQDANHWFVHVEHPGTWYGAQIGSQTENGGWHPLAVSGDVRTPPDWRSENTTVEFATIPIETPLATLRSFVGGDGSAEFSLAEALERMRSEGHPDLPAAPPQPVPTVQTQLAQTDPLELGEEAGCFPPTSFSHGPGNPFDRGAAATSPGGIPSSSSGGLPEKAFQMNVNAELIVYGATLPNATVSVGGQRMQLRPDGSFSVRFALPDGQYQLPVVAVSADYASYLSADLSFSRATQRCGEIGCHPQAMELQAPPAAMLPGTA